MRILGVDPGSRLTGYGCIEIANRQLRHLSHGTLKVAQWTQQEISSLEDRLLLIYEGLSAVIAEFKPQVMVVEKVFLAKNAMSALKLGQARGAILLTGKIHALEVFEYSPTEVKQIVAGHGRADKEAVAKMVQLIVGAQKFSSFDASDGLALAICHAYSSASPLRSSYGNQPEITPKKKNLSMAESVGMGVGIGTTRPRATYTKKV